MTKQAAESIVRSPWLWDEPTVQEAEKVLEQYRQWEKQDAGSEGEQRG